MTYDAEWNDGYIVEGMDRCHTIMVMIDELLVDHPAIEKAHSTADLTLAYNIIMDIYQKIGSIDD